MIFKTGMKNSRILMQAKKVFIVWNEANNLDTPESISNDSAVDKAILAFC